MNLTVVGKRMPCLNCFQGYGDHVRRQCLFTPTRYKRMAPEELLNLSMFDTAMKMAQWQVITKLVIRFESEANNDSLMFSWRVNEQDRASVWHASGVTTDELRLLVGL